MDHSHTDQLKSLHTAAIDARNGYTEALDNAKGKGLSPLFDDMIVMHSQNADELASELRRLGEKADESGSFMTAVHRTIMNVRSMFNGLGDNVLPGLIDGEMRNLKHYNDVLETPHAWAELKPVLLTEHGRIEASIVRMRAAHTPVQ
jgi:uncharacterized protein (TIGR02284 family)